MGEMILTARDLAARTNLSERFFQKLAKRVNWASQPEGCRSIRFDAEGFEDWLKKGRPRVHKWRSTGETGGHTPARRSRVSNIGKPLERALSEKLRALTSDGSQRSKMRLHRRTRKQPSEKP